MKKGFGLFFTLCLFAGNSAQAQYRDLLNPQTQQQVQKFKEQKVAVQNVFLEINGSQAPFGMVKYDAEGRITSNISPKSRQYFSYDANGKLSAFIDSAHDGRRFWKNEYAFAFDAEGRPENFRIGKTTSQFSYNAAQRELVETAGSAGTIYKYNEEGKLTEEITEGGDEPKIHRYMYNKYGDLASELIAIQNANGTDSTRIMYSYDSKGRLLRKQTLRTQRLNESEDPTAPQTFTKSTQTTNYTYDVRSGLLTAENTVSSNPKESGKTEWVYDLNGLPVKESKLDAAGKPIQILVYRYSYTRQ